MVKYSKSKSFIHYLKNRRSSSDTFFDIYFGKCGCGKSTYIAKLWYQFCKSKSTKDFYTNVYINTSDSRYHYIDLSEHILTDFVPINAKTKKYKCFTGSESDKVLLSCFTEGCIIAVDELGLIAHCRDYKNFPKEFTNLVKVRRHLGYSLIGFSQSYDIDKTLRLSANSLYIIKKFGFWSLAKKLDKDVSLLRSDQINASADNQIVDTVDYASIIYWHLTFIPFYTDLFDSFD